MRISEIGKYIVYRTPYFKRLMMPSYPLKISPGQVTALLNAIDDSCDEESVVVEVGVARGDTSVVLLEHIKSSGRSNKCVFVDTFSGFTRESIDFEVTRGKPRSRYDAFRYGDENQFIRNLNRLGYSNFTTLKGDAGSVDWSKAGKISAMLLDIDLYEPTIKTLRGVWPHLLPGAVVVVDDCIPNSSYDGSLQAYLEFVAEIGASERYVGGKGGVIQKPK
ncbi:class I SAM-dependent methyltransferase [Marinicauda pacifica]|uniref:class I SAM-dependent methyltransferase n=1 Tax=Marinicauda pacifica TaxID=1133559 RepID=UPI0035C7916E